MSSKFSCKTLRSKPPGVCRYSPPPPPPWEPPFEDQPFQGYVIFSAPHMTPEAWLTGSLVAEAISPSPTWFGRLVGDILVIEVTLRWHSSDQTMSYDFDVLRPPWPHWSETASHRRPRSIDRFNSGEISFEPPPFQGQAACHFWW